MKKLSYHQKMMLRDEICKIKLEGLSDVENYELQGKMLYNFGFDEMEAKYPDDTWVGVHRLNGFKKKRRASA